MRESGSLEGKALRFGGRICYNSLKQRIQIALEGSERMYVFVLQELQSTVDYTMIFRLVMYIMDLLSRYLLAAPKNEWEQAGFRLPAVAPVVFYNGADRWTAVQDFKEYQTAGGKAGC